MSATVLDPTSMLLTQCRRLVAENARLSAALAHEKRERELLEQRCMELENQINELEKGEDL